MGKPLPGRPISRDSEVCRHLPLLRRPCRAHPLKPESLCPQMPSTTTAYVRWEPRWGCAWLSCRGTSPSGRPSVFWRLKLMAGNVAFSPNTPRASCSVPLRLSRWSGRAGFPRGSFQTLLLEVNQVETVLGDERIARSDSHGQRNCRAAQSSAQAGWQH